MRTLKTHPIRFPIADLPSTLRKKTKFRDFVNLKFSVLNVVFFHGFGELITVRCSPGGGRGPVPFVGGGPCGGPRDQSEIVDKKFRKLFVSAAIYVQ